jgi:hypothetical protein
MNFFLGILLFLLQPHLVRISAAIRIFVVVFEPAFAFLEWPWLTQIKVFMKVYVVHEALASFVFAGDTEGYRLMARPEVLEAFLKPH